VIDYRHLIEGLKRKPQAFKGLVFRDALFPGEVYRRTWEVLDARLLARQACRAMVGLLELAARQACEAELAEALAALLAQGELPELATLAARFEPRLQAPPSLEVPLPAIDVYDVLIGAELVP
jgi:hypothetical protein